MQNKTKIITALFTLSLVTSAFSIRQHKDLHIDYSKVEASAISEYYQNINGKGSGLLESINTTISTGVTKLGYDGLWNAYQTSDVRDDGKIYDIYSDCTSFTPGSKQCGSYKNIGDCYNREHTIPQSWWGGGTGDQGNDLVLVLPSDGKINGMRSNNPYGETTSGTAYRMSNDPSGNRLGSSTSTQYCTGTVFEPFDNRKGDLARTYFYAMARYLKDSYKKDNAMKWTDGEGDKVFSSNGNNGFVQSYLDMLLAWHTADPVSAWEIKRNNYVQQLQGNRNPFIDHPSWVDLIWGGTYGSNKANGENTSAGKVTNGVLDDSGDDPVVPIDITLTINKSSANLVVDESTTITATLIGSTSTINWTTSDATVAELSSSTGTTVTVTAKKAGNATITCSSEGATSKTCEIYVTSSGSSTPGSYTLVDSDFPASYGTGTFTKEGITYSQTSIARYSDIQFQKSNGVLYNTTPISYITSIQLNVSSGKSNNCQVYSGTSSTNINTAVSGSNNLYTFTSNCPYFKIQNTSGGASNFSSIVINYSSAAASKTLSKIEVSGQQTEFEANDSFTFGGVVTATFSDSSTDNVTAQANFTGYDMSQIGPQIVTVSYTYQGHTEYANYSINVSSTQQSSSSSQEEQHDITECYGQITLNGSSTGITGTDETQEITARGFSFGGKFKQYSSTALWFTSGSGYIYNKESLGNIISITLSYRAGGSNSAYQYIRMGNTVQNSHSASSTNGQLYQSSTGGQSTKFTPSNSYGFFAISVTNKNLQLTSLVIEYDEAEAFAVGFNNAKVCGSNDNTSAISSKWLEQKDKYELICDGAKEYLRTINTSSCSTQVKECIDRYDMVIAKHGDDTTNFPNFINRNVVNQSNVINEYQATDIFAFISIALAFSFSMLLFLMSKRRKNKNY